LGGGVRQGRWAVRLTDPHGPTLDAAPGLIRDELHALHAHGLVDDPEGSAARVSAATGLADAVTSADFVQENGPETVEAKQALFADLDRLARPGAVLASSTSAIVASRFTEGLPGRARCLVGHPVNPPHLVPLVELCGAPWTSPGTIERARAVYQGIGQVAVTVNREVEGFVLNRLQGLRASHNCGTKCHVPALEEGVETAETPGDGFRAGWLVAA